MIEQVSNPPYEIEELGEPDQLFYHIPKGIFKTKNNYEDIPPHAFTPVGETLSVNWEKYCHTPQECLNIKTDRYPQGRSTKTHGVGHFIVKEVNAIPALRAMHAPTSYNRAHSVLAGFPDKKLFRPPYNELRVKLRTIFKWDIPPADE